MPRVSVVMVVREDDPFLKESIDSILSQTLSDIELIIVQDAMCGDETLSRMDDPRVRVVHNDQPLGQARSLNLGYALASGEYIARADVGDVSLPERLEGQAAYLDSHPQVAVVGSAIRQFEDSGNMRTARHPTTPALVVWGMHFGMAMCPSSMMMRRSAFEQIGGYSTTAYLIDYDLLCRIMRHHGLTSMPDVLLECHASEDMVVDDEHIFDSVRRTIEVTLSRPIKSDFVRALLYPDTIDGRYEAIGAAWLLNSVVRSYRMWYRDRTREEGVQVKDDAAARMSHILTKSMKAAPLAIPMILWQTSRAGPGVSARLGIEAVKRGIEHMNGIEAVRMNEQNKTLGQSA